MADRESHPERPETDNPYESPQAESFERGSAAFRFSRAIRRAWSAYREEIRNSEITTIEHLGAWFAMAFWGSIALGMATALLWFLFSQFFGL